MKACLKESRVWLPGISKFFGVAVFGLILLGSGAAAAAGQTLTPVPGKPMAPDFTLKDSDGKAHRLAGLRGKVVLVNFWATWCQPCRREMPSMERLWQLLKKENFMIVAVNVAEDAGAISRFTSTLKPVPTFPIVLDPEGAVQRAWPSKGLPTTFLIDKEGRIVYRAVGGLTFDDPALVGQIRALMRAG